MSSECERGPGFWKLSTKVIESQLFSNTFKTFWQAWSPKIIGSNSKKEWWELTKVKIKELSIEVAKQLSKAHNIELSKLEKAICTERNTSPENVIEIERYIII